MAIRSARLWLIGALATCALLASGGVAAAASWSVQPAASAGSWASFSGVSCPSVQFCVAVGNSADSGSLIEHWDGGSWTTDSAPGGPYGRLFNVSCASAAACIAVGELGVGTPLVLHWDGRAWAETPPATPTDGASLALPSISCTSATACVAVGAYQLSGGGQTWFPLVERWDGSQWMIQTVASPPAHASLRAISCSSGSACTAVGSTGGSEFAERFGGAVWKEQPTALFDVPTVASLAGVSCPAFNACTAVGTFDDDTTIGAVTGGHRALAERWDGVRWTRQPMPPGTDQTISGDGTRGSLSAVSCPTASVCAAVGAEMIVRWDTGVWTLQPAPAPAPPGSYYFRGVSCPELNICTAVGDYSSATGAQPFVERYS